MEDTEVTKNAISQWVTAVKIVSLYGEEFSRYKKLIREQTKTSNIANNPAKVSTSSEYGLHVLKVHLASIRYNEITKELYSISQTLSDLKRDLDGVKLYPGEYRFGNCTVYVDELRQTKIELEE